MLHEQRVVVTGGTLRTGNGYEQRLTLEVYEGGVRLSTEVYEDRGEVWANVFTGNPILRSTVRPGLKVATEAVRDDGYFTGELDVLQELAGERQQVTLRFGSRDKEGGRCTGPGPREGSRAVSRPREEDQSGGTATSSGAI